MTAAVNKSFKQRAMQLEATMSQLRQIVAKLDNCAIQSSLNVSNPEIYSQLRNIKTFLDIGTTIPPAGILHDDREGSASLATEGFAFRICSTGLKMSTADTVTSNLPYLEDIHEPIWGHLSFIDTQDESSTWSIPGMSMQTRL